MPPEDLPVADSPPKQRWRNTRWGKVTTVAILVAAVALTAFSVGRLSTLHRDGPAASGPEAGFLRDMAVHHDQGVELSYIIRDRSDDDALRLLAFDIATTQGGQSGAITGWLQAWDIPQYTAQPSMSWMHTNAPSTAADSSHSTHTPGQPMPGLATAEQLDVLQSLTGVEAEIEFLELMIAHHVGAVEMAEALLQFDVEPMVHTFATNIIFSQESEIGLMESMLADRGVQR